MTFLKPRALLIALVLVMSLCLALLPGASVRAQSDVSIFGGSVSLTLAEGWTLEESGFVAGVADISGPDGVIGSVQALPSGERDVQQVLDIELGSIGEEDPVSFSTLEGTETIIASGLVRFGEETTSYVVYGYAADDYTIVLVFTGVEEGGQRAATDDIARSLSIDQGALDSFLRDVRQDSRDNRNVDTPVRVLDRGVIVEIPTLWQFLETENGLLAFADGDTPFADAVQVFIFPYDEVAAPEDAMQSRVEAAALLGIQTAGVEAAEAPEFRFDIEGNGDGGNITAETLFEFPAEGKTYFIYAGARNFANGYIVVVGLSSVDSARDTYRAVLDSAAINPPRLASALGFTPLGDTVLALGGALRVSVPEGWSLLDNGTDAPVVVLGNRPSTPDTFFTIALANNPDADLEGFLQSQLGSLGISDPVEISEVEVQGQSALVAAGALPTEEDVFTMVVFRRGDYIVTALFAGPFDTELEGDQVNAMLSSLDIDLTLVE